MVLETSTVKSAPRLRPRTWRRTLLRWVTLLSLLYVIVLLVLVALENWLIYHPGALGEPVPPPAGMTVDDVELKLDDGTRIHAWWCPTKDTTVTILFCHGNAGDLSHRGELIAHLQEKLQASVLIFDYPGYGRSEGTPSEKGCCGAGDAAYDWLIEKANIAPDRIVLLGESLGGGVATDLASRRPHRALVLCMTFTSMPDAGRHALPFVPTQWLMRNRFDNLAKIDRCTRPIFIVHGKDDGVIPAFHSERLFDAAPGAKQLCLLDGVGHGGVFNETCLSELRSFLNKH